MRITDDRYRRELQQINVARRLILLEARTRTIRMWTGLSDDRIRKLYREYLNGPPGSAAPRRHRGKSPQQSSFFLRSARLRQETASLASICSLLGVVPSKLPLERGRPVQNLDRAALLCDACEVRDVLHPDSRITVEHASYLVIAISRGEELRLLPCSNCSALFVTDSLGIREARCVRCDAHEGARPVGIAAAIGESKPEPRPGR
jgi:hypothetical protein